MTPSPKNIHSPRNFVAIKKVDTYSESAIVNGASVSSYVFSAMK